VIDSAVTQLLDEPLYRQAALAFAAKHCANEPGALVEDAYLKLKKLVEAPG